MEMYPMSWDTTPDTTAVVDVKLQIILSIAKFLEN